MLDIYVNGMMVGVLDQPDPYSFVFNYLPDAPADMPVSLLMPKRTESWVSRGLHPVFQISLPEGALRSLIERQFAKRFDRFGEMELLAIVGENMVGRVQAVPHGQSLSNRTTHESLTNLLEDDTSALVDHYLGDRLPESGVSGGFMKFLTRSPVESEGKHATLTLDQWIVKLNDADHPNIVLLEYFGMMAAERAGLPTPTVFLSKDRQRLLVQRFDVKTDGGRLGFEDMCALLGLPSRDKFTSSAERIVKAIRDYCPGAQAQPSIDQFFGQYLLCSSIRNGDAHLKNFGLLYENAKAVKLAPVYDMLSMSAYAPQHSASTDADDGMAINFMGSKKWLTEKSIKQLADRCLVSASRKQHWLSVIPQAMLSTASEVLRFLKAHPEDGFADQAKRMLTLWAHGLENMNKDGDASRQMREKADSIVVPNEGCHPEPPRG